MRNWNRTFPDVSVSALVDDRNNLAVTSSTSLAGAIASVKAGGKEFVASGGHGAALQYAFHAWQKTGRATECYNPTQAGARIDDVGQREPYHGPSTSALYVMAKAGSSIRTESRPAMYLTRADRQPGYDGCLAANVQPNTSPFTLGLSPYWLRTQVQLAPDNKVAALKNVVRLSADLTSEDSLHEQFDGVLIAYLQRDFVRVYSYEPTGDVLTPGPAAEYVTKDPVLRCTADHLHCLGMYVRPAVLGTSAYYYTMTRPPSPYNGMAGEYTMQVTSPAVDVAKGDVLTYETFLVVGNRDRVASTIRQLHQALT
ncbi:hypothetical protein ABGB14_11625 [Nonomuraea sp. B10E15]|uniref:hypothetical protein n=1 Tax=Nonomuraea sp. B10E15 TaxID=3153560 RepID=UPI00325E0828